MESPPPASNSRDPLRFEAARRVIEERERQRKAGVRVSDRQLMLAHPELMPELREALRGEREIRRSIREARRTGPVPPAAEQAPIRLMSDGELFAEIDIESSGDSDPPPAKSPLSDLPTILNYQVEERLGVGGQAIVYKALQESTGRRVAVKVLPGGSAVSSRQRERFDRESTILATLDHPNIVPILDRGRTLEDSFFYAMPVYAGQDFEEHIASLRKSRDLKAIIAMFARISDAVGEAHRKGVVHRDLKPSNVLLNERGDPFVVDFGLARPDDDFSVDEWARITLTQEGQIIGSLPWASPEQVNSEGRAKGRVKKPARQEVDFRSDVYSLGVMLYQAVTGQFPYAVDGSTLATVGNILTAHPDRPSRLMSLASAGIGPTAVDDVILRCLEKRPADRYSDAAALAKDLEFLIAGQAPSPGPRQAARKWRLRVGVAAAVVMGAVLGGAWFVANREPVVEVIKLPSFKNSIGMQLVRIPAGIVMTGSPLNEEGRSGHEIARTYPIERPFYVSTTEVTVGQYRRVMGVSPSGAGNRDDLPVHGISREEAEEFCRRLMVMEPTRVYRLPDEIEWEYACRAGTKGAFGGTGRAQSMAWHRDNSGNTPHPVASKSPNHWGLYDMHGNVAEMCRNRFPDREKTDELRAVRGGAFNQHVSNCRSAARRTAALASPGIGFRVVCEDPS